VVERRVLLLLDLNNGAILEVPLDDVGLLRSALGVLGLVESRPELVEVLELDEVPDVRERGWSVASQPLRFATRIENGYIPLMTADSVTEVLVGMAPDILTVVRLKFEFCVLW
jgi:hypothetical protein